MWHGTCAALSFTEFGRNLAAAARSLILFKLKKLYGFGRWGPRGSSSQAPFFHFRMEPILPDFKGQVQGPHVTYEHLYNKT